MDDETIRDLIEASSLGSPEVKAYRALTPERVRMEILRGLGRDGSVGERMVARLSELSADALPAD